MVGRKVTRRYNKFYIKSVKEKKKSDETQKSPLVDRKMTCRGNKFYFCAISKVLLFARGLYEKWIFFGLLPALIDSYMIKRSL